MRILTAMHRLLDKTDGRDRVARATMFGMKFVRGYLRLRIERAYKIELRNRKVPQGSPTWRDAVRPDPVANSGAPLFLMPKGTTTAHRLLERAEQVHELLLESRRTFRFFKIVMVFASLRTVRAAAHNTLLKQCRMLRSLPT